MAVPGFTIGDYVMIARNTGMYMTCGIALLKQKQLPEKKIHTAYKYC